MDVNMTTSAKKPKIQLLGEQFKLLFDNCSNALVVFDPSGNIIDANQKKNDFGFYSSNVILQHYDVAVCGVSIHPRIVHPCFIEVFGEFFL